MVQPLSPWFGCSGSPHLAGQEGAVLELAEEEGQEESAGHEHQGQQRRVGLRHPRLEIRLHVVLPLQRVILENLGREEERVRESGDGRMCPTLHPPAMVRALWHLLGGFRV